MDAQQVSHGDEHNISELEESGKFYKYIYMHVHRKEFKCKYSKKF